MKKVPVPETPRRTVREAEEAKSFGRKKKKILNLTWAYMY